MGEPAGIDDRVLRAPRDQRPGWTDDVSYTPWPPPTNGPIPRSLPVDLTIFTAWDELDAWAHEHDAATETLAGLRTTLAEVQVEYMRQRARARRTARASPTERGRRTAQDIDAEVDEALIESGILARKMDVETAIENALGRLFRARDNQARVENYVRSLPRVDHRP